jgi:pimeloyl-ACP methyl ester carboxylesterase
MQQALLGPKASLAAKARLRTMIEGCPHETIVGALLGMRDRPGRSHVLGSIEVPSAVVVGEHDTVTTPDSAAEMADALPDAVLVTIPDAGHLTPIEQPQAVNAALRDLFGRT